MHIAAAENVPVEGVLNLRAVDGVLEVSLDPSASFEALREELRETFSATPDRFRGMDARLDLSTRRIDLFDLRRMVHVLRDEFGVTVTGLYCTQENLHRYTERELKLKVYLRRDAKVEEPPAVLSEVEEDVTPVTEEEQEDRVAVDASQRVLTIDKGLRSGQIVRFGGDVQVFGDVNPGAQIIAGGNILVFGALKGMVHAGSQGDDEAVILAFDMQPTQLRVGRKIQFPEARTRGGKQGYAPELAWVEHGQIEIAPYQGRLPR